MAAGAGARKNGVGGVEAVDAALQARIFREQVRLLYRSAVPLVVNLVNTAIVAAVLWPVLGAAALVWAALMVAVVAGRFALRARFHAGGEAVDAALWARRHAIGAGVTGALWGATATVILAIDVAGYHLFVGLVAAGMSAGAVAALSFHLPSLYAFVGPCVLPMAIVFARTGEPTHLGLGAMAVIFAVALAGLARLFNGALVEALRLRFENADLLRSLTATQEMADAASRSSWEILARISHELRTPLNAINGFAEIMRRQMFGAVGHRKYEEYIRDIGDSAAHLLALVDEILQYSRGHTGSLALDEAMVDTRSAIEVCLNMHAEAAAAGRVELVRELADDLPALRADPVKLRQIVVNLLSNAIKFTPAGGRVTLSAGVDGEGAMTIVIADSGVGIRPEDLPRALQPYVQIENPFTRTRTGLGLGLPLAKRLTELHGGTLHLESAPGRGTTATVRFPPSRSATSDAGGGHRVYGDE